MVVSSFICTTLPLPIPLADISFMATLRAFNSLYWYSIIIITITITDTIFAILTYKLGHKLSSRFVRSEKAKARVSKIKDKLENNKWADLWVFLASATPLPFTLTIYATSILSYKMEKFIPLIFIGRLVKYTAVGLAFYFGYNLIGG